MEDEIRAAEARLDKALNKIRESKPGGMTKGMEVSYGQAYQELVRLGARTQLRLKYRSG